MSRISQTDKANMYELAVEIIEHKREDKRHEAIGVTSNIDAICRLYDQADTAFCAERVKSLLDELNETQAENQRLRKTLGTPRKLFTCAGCGAEGLDDPLETDCHCMVDNARWIESVIYQPEKTDDTPA